MTGNAGESEGQTSLLIRRAELRGGDVVDIRVADGLIAALGELAPLAGETVIDARGACLLPGLHDHHIHIMATAAARNSLRCGPPDVVDAEDLACRLRIPGEGWLRGIGYHISVAGLIDRFWLDEIVPERPVRIQDMTGRLWILNSMALEQVLDTGLPAPVGLERVGGTWTGRLFDEDRWLRRALDGHPPSLRALGAQFARFGVCGLTDMSPSNGRTEVALFDQAHARGDLPQRVLVAGTSELAGARFGPATRLGPLKIHLHEAHLPAHDAVIADIQTAHAQGRGVAVHCVTEVELIYTLAALREAGALSIDRIEHASVTSDALLGEIAGMGLCVVTQPVFVFERGDGYRRDIDAADWPHLYRLRAFLDASVPLAGSSDAPFGTIDPWASMAAAVRRRTRDGEPLGESEALGPEEALDLFLRDPTDLRRRREIWVGAPADLCLLDRPWAGARECLSADLVRATCIAGRLVHDRVDESPSQGFPGVDPPA